MDQWETSCFKFPHLTRILYNRSTFWNIVVLKEPKMMDSVGNTGEAYCSIR